MSSFYAFGIVVGLLELAAYRFFLRRPPQAKSWPLNPKFQSALVIFWFSSALIISPALDHTLTVSHGIFRGIMLIAGYFVCVRLLSDVKKLADVEARIGNNYPLQN